MLYTLFTEDIPDPRPRTDIISFADDITQVITGYNYRYIAKQTERAIKEINTYKRKWKIQTNTKKFQIIPIGRRNTTQIKIDQQDYEYTPHGKILGLNFNTWGIKNQVTTRKQIARDSLGKLYRFRDLSQQNKLKLYKSLVQSALIYPVIPLNTISKPAMLQLQTVQNQALRFVTNTRWYHFKTAESLHTECRIQPVNITIHTQAKNLWAKIKTNNPDLYRKATHLISPNLTTHSYFPSSRRIAEGPTPGPLYTTSRRNR